jgi:hypothetical protein
MWILQSPISREIHLAPFSRVDEAVFRKDADALKAQSESEGCAVAELMALVAELHDGHSYINLINAPTLRRWFPIRFYWFKDGRYGPSSRRSAGNAPDSASSRSVG